MMKINNPGLIDLHKSLRIRDAAYQFILDYEVPYPIKSVELALQFADVCDYEYITQNPPTTLSGMNISIHQLRNKFGDGFVCKDGSNYVIAFDSEIPPNRINWTLIHEVSHIVLHHLYDGQILHAFPDNQLESATDIFTLFIICPDILLSKYNMTNSQLISNTFHIPHQKVKAYGDYLIFSQMNISAKTNIHYMACDYFDRIYNSK